MDYYDDRTIEALHLSNNTSVVFGWCNVNCICDSCLLADAILAFAGKPSVRINPEGLYRDRQISDVPGVLGPVAPLARLHATARAYPH